MKKKDDHKEYLSVWLSLFFCVKDMVAVHKAVPTIS